MAKDIFDFDKALPASAGRMESAVDQIMASLGGEIALLGFGETLHGGEEILQMRNRFFQRLVEAHGFTAIAMESSFPRSRLVNQYVHGAQDVEIERLWSAGFGQGMGQLQANRELVEWMRAWNMDCPHSSKVSFYGFDIPSGTMGVGSPRHVLSFVTDYLAAADPKAAIIYRERFRGIADDDTAWENPEVYMDPTKSIALQPEASALRSTIEDCIGMMDSKRPSLQTQTGFQAWSEAKRYAEVARELLCFHAAMGLRKIGESPAVVLGVRDASMAKNLRYIVQRECPQGRVLAFAHNSHLQRGEAQWPGQKYWGTEDECRWSPAGSHLALDFGSRYAVIGTAIGESVDNGIGKPESESIEAHLNEKLKSESFLPLHLSETSHTIARQGSVLNPTYVPLNVRVNEHFDWLAWLPRVSYNRGGPPLQAWDVVPKSGE